MTVCRPSADSWQLGVINQIQQSSIYWLPWFRFPLTWMIGSLQSLTLSGGRFYITRSEQTHLSPTGAQVRGTAPDNTVGKDTTYERAGVWHGENRLAVTRLKKKHLTGFEDYILRSMLKSVLVEHVACSQLHVLSVACASALPQHNLGLPDCTRIGRMRGT